MKQHTILRNQPKRHHYIPQSYLREFCNDDGKIFVYDKEQARSRCDSVKNVAVKKHCYTSIDKKENLTAQFEELLAEYDSKGIDAIRKLERREILSVDERVEFSAYIALMICRDPDMIEAHEQLAMRGIRQYMRQLAPMYRPQGNEFNDLIIRSIAISSSFQNAFSKVADLFKKNWNIYHLESSSDSIITTDLPVFPYSPRLGQRRATRINVGDHDVALAIPISASCLLVMGGNGGCTCHKVLRPQECCGANLSLAKCAHRLIISKNEQLLDRIIRTISNLT